MNDRRVVRGSFPVFRGPLTLGLLPASGQNPRLRRPLHTGAGLICIYKDRILFMFDEPTTGLHFYDVEKLLKAFDALLSRGHSVIVVEHNLDVIRSADWVIDLGPDAGDRGGEVVFAGTPEDLAAHGNTFTAQYLR